MEYKILASGSRGNCLIIDNRIAIDLGVPYKAIKPYEKSLQVIFYTHTHGDHYKKETLLSLQFNRPALRVACSKHDAEILKSDGVQNVDVLNIGQIYSYGSFKICPIQLYHDVPTIGFRLWIAEKSIFFATDTMHLNGITAKNYDMYFIECNYDEERIHDVIQEKREQGEFCHQTGSMNSHLSMQQAQAFVLKNVSPGHEYKFVPLHLSSEF